MRRSLEIHSKTPSAKPGFQSTYLKTSKPDSQWHWAYFHITSENGPSSALCFFEKISKVLIFSERTVISVHINLCWICNEVHNTEQILIPCKKNCLWDTKKLILLAKKINYFVSNKLWNINRWKKIDLTKVRVPGKELDLKINQWCCSPNFYLT